MAELTAAAAAPPTSQPTKRECDDDAAYPVGKLLRRESAAVHGFLEMHRRLAYDGPRCDYSRRTWRLKAIDHPVLRPALVSLGLSWYYLWEPDMVEDLRFAGQNFKQLRTAEQLERFKALAAPARFGRGTETVLDPAVRRALSIDLTADGGRHCDIASNNFLSSKELLADIVTAMTRLSIHRYFRVVASRAHIYDKGDHFEEHRDTPKGHGHIASLVAILPPVHTGGVLHLRHPSNEATEPVEVVACAEGDDDDPPTIVLVAFPTDCPHRIDPVTDGCRVSIQWDIYATSKEQADAGRKNGTPGVMWVGPEDADGSDDEEDVLCDDRPCAFSKPAGAAASLEPLEPISLSSKTRMDIIVDQTRALLRDAEADYSAVVLECDFNYAASAVGCSGDDADEDSVSDCESAVLKGVDGHLYRALAATADLDIHVVGLAIRVTVSPYDQKRPPELVYTVLDMSPRVRSLMMATKCSRRAANDVRVAVIGNQRVNVPSPSWHHMHHEPGSDYTGNEALDPVHSYVHAGLFIRLFQ